MIDQPGLVVRFFREEVRGSEKNKDQDALNPGQIFEPSGIVAFFPYPLPPFSNTCCFKYFLFNLVKNNGARRAKRR